MLKRVICYLIIIVISLNVISAEEFIRGDANNDERLDLSDAIFILNYLFKGSQQPSCSDALDVNDDGKIDISDPIYVFLYLFLGGNQPAEPFNQKGNDPTNDDLSCRDLVNNYCTKNTYKVAFILLVQNKLEITNQRMEKLQNIKNSFPESFRYATLSHATIDTSYDIIQIIDDGTIISEPLKIVNLQKIPTIFYKSHPDIFDFLIVFTAFDDNGPGGNEAGTYFQVRNYVHGIGNLIEEKSFASEGSQQLLGMVNAYNIDNFYTMNLLLHELGHQWCCEVGDNFAQGIGNPILEIRAEGGHFYPGLASPYEKAATLMGPSFWVANDDGTFRREEDSTIPKRYHPFELYLMGLLPQEEYSNKYTLYNAGLLGKDFDDQHARIYKEVNVNDIVAVAGERLCAAEYVEASKKCIASELTDNNFKDIGFHFKINGAENDKCSTKVVLTKFPTDPSKIGDSMSCSIPLLEIKDSSLLATSLSRYVSQGYCEGPLTSLYR